MPQPSTYADELHEVTRLWWLTLLVGLLSVAAGVIVLLKPGDSLATIAVVIGIFIVIDGLVALLAALRRGAENRGLMVLISVLSLVVGIVLIRHPIQGVAAVALFVGIWLVAMGVVRFVYAFDAPEHRGWRFLVAAVEILAGIVIVSSPGIGVATLALLVGIALIVNGAALTTLGFALHGAGEQGALPTPHGLQT